MMSKKEKEFCFTGPLAGVISNFFEDMRLSGRVYNAEGYYLQVLACLTAVPYALQLRAAHL